MGLSVKEPNFLPMVTPIPCLCAVERLMYGFGDSERPLPQTVQVVEVSACRGGWSWHGM